MTTLSRWWSVTPCILDTIRERSYQTVPPNVPYYTRPSHSPYSFMIHESLLSRNYKIIYLHLFILHPSSLMQPFTTELRQKIEDHIQHYIQLHDLYYIDYRDELSKDNLQKIIETWSLDSDDLYTEYDSYIEILKDIEKTFDLSEEFLEEHRDELTDNIYIKCANATLPDLIKNAWPQSVRLTAYSNYEGIRSDYDYQSFTGYEYSEGFKDIVDILSLDPQTLKKTLVAKGFKVSWSFPTIKSRIGKEYVSYSDFIQELNNTTSSCNLLTFVWLVDARDFFTHDKPCTRITIPRGNSCGLFDSFQGGWSLIECTLLRDFTIDIATLHGPSSYDNWSLDIDDQGNGYSIDSVYGVTREFWWKEISIQ